ncbi:hypothetical protein DITRI_Ditri01bG0089500 [Diplodiscus trichospermus]
MLSFHQSKSLQSKPEIEVEDGVFLTWEDLWVRVPGGADGSRSILQGLTGYARPGELLAIMGPSGCGKSTLLDALAGRLAPNARQAGDILINRRKQGLAYGTSAYVTQDDALIATLTVREAVSHSAQLQLPDKMSRSEKEQRAEMTIREMGLQGAMNTRIGGWGAKELSGGEKRRLGICIEILTCPKLLFLDEPTSGLDSAASYYVMSRIASLSRKDGIGRTIIVSIHQPRIEVFQLFHNLYLLSDGQTVYFGNISAANDLFALNGFPCPAFQNQSDHFLKTINKDFDNDIEQGFANSIPTEEVINILVQSYKSSDTCQQVQREIARSRNQDGAAMREKAHSTFFTQCNVLTRRSFINMYRDKSYYWLRLPILIVLALGIVSLFTPLRRSFPSIQARGALIIFLPLFLAFLTLGGFPSFVEEMKVFERERLNGHYGVTAFVFANTFSALPFLTVISLIPGAVCYYIPCLHQGFEHFLFFVSTLFVCMMLVESLLMIVASLVPSFLMGVIVATGIQGMMVLVAGFFRLPSELPKPIWRYPLHYISLHKYAFQGLLKNEFEGLTFPNIQAAAGAGEPPTLTGEEILRNTWHVEMGYSKWVDLAILFSMAVLYGFLFLCIIKTTEKVKPMIAKFKSSVHCQKKNLSFKSEDIIQAETQSRNIRRSVNKFVLQNPPFK